MADNDNDDGDLVPVVQHHHVYTCLSKQNRENVVCFSSPENKEALFFFNLIILMIYINAGSALSCSRTL